MSIVKERPILFSGPMVNAILEGGKTQTRRIVKPQPMPGVPFVGIRDGIAVFEKWYHPTISMRSENKCPYGKPGDSLWVRETWGSNGCLNCPIHYRATEPEWKNNTSNPLARWRPSIHMPRCASRITLEVTGISVERLRNISEEDAIAEGLSAITKDGQMVKYGISDRDGLPGNDDYGWHWSEWEKDPREAYRKLWESINGPGSWNANPWVWVIEFKRIQPRDGGANMEV